MQIFPSYAIISIDEHLQKHIYTTFLIPTWFRMLKQAKSLTELR